jgi:type IV secretory pathway VirB9-like protein
MKKIKKNLKRLPPAANFLLILCESLLKKQTFFSSRSETAFPVPSWVAGATRFLKKVGQKLLLISIILIMCGVGLFSQLKTAKLIATFDDKDKNYIDTVYCREKYETTFILPPERQIKKVVTGDPDEWEIVGKYGGRIVSVKPMQGATQTSLTIVTRSMKIYKFNIVNIDTVRNPGYDVMAIVEIREKNTTMEVISRGDNPVDEIKHRDEEILNDRRKLEQKKEQMLIKLNYNYKWKEKHFEIENVYDDGIFTYIVMPGTREIPAVYISAGKKSKSKSLEPIKYVVKPGLIVIHRVIEGKERILLRLGSEKDRKEAQIYRKKKGR